MRPVAGRVTLVVFGAVVSFVILSWPWFLSAEEPVSSPLAGTSHEFEFGSVEPTDGFCSSACHDYLDSRVTPELSEVISAWSIPLAANSSGVVAAMCGSCHHSTGGYAVVMADAFSDANAYDARSHGRRMTLSSPPPGTDTLAAGLPRIETEFFHCTTCHDPHSDTHRPFLREDGRELCVRCHSDRGFVDGDPVTGEAAKWGNWQSAVFGGEANPGSHPVGSDVMGGRPNGPSVVIPDLFRVAVARTPGLWSAGPHLSEGSTGGMTCLTCHTVHGLALENGTAEVGTCVPPNTGYLAVAQQCKNLPSYSRSLPNGDGGINVLCESCHGTGGDPALRPDGSSWDGTCTNAHPGRPGAYSHPADGYPSGYDLNESGVPSYWPSGRGGATAAGSVLICETCHVPHPLAAVKAGRADVRAADGGYLLRIAARGDDGQERLCDVCHPMSLPGHHPVGKSYDPTGAAFLANAPSGSRATLRCSTCHNTAHDWRAAGRPALDFGWSPVDGGRSVEQAADMFHPDMSKSCMDCHYFMDGHGVSVSPTKGTRQTVIRTDSPEYEHFQSRDFSMGTHYIGRIHDEDKERWSNEPLIDMYDLRRTWKMQAPESGSEGVMGDGWSRFGGADEEGRRVLVCESCHELEPDRNNGNAHLLLAPFREGQVGMSEYDGDTDGKDMFCRLCHGVLKGSHPMTGDMVSARKSEGDCELDSHSPALRETILGDAILLRDGDVDAMSCDSCHQPHDANSASFTFMLDSADDVPEIEPILFKPADIQNGYGTLNEDPLIFLEADGSPRTYATPKLSNCNVMGLCRQCHGK